MCAKKFNRIKLRKIITYVQVKMKLHLQAQVLAVSHQQAGMGSGSYGVGGYNTDVESGQFGKNDSSTPMLEQVSWSDKSVSCFIQSISLVIHYSK